MGKIRKPKGQNQKKKIDSESIEEPILENPVENVIQTIIDQLQAASIEEKCGGLQTFAMIIESSDKLEQVISRGLVKVTGPLLMDTAGPVRHASAGILRNLSTMGHEVCDALMDQDVMTPLTCYFHELAESWIPDPKTKVNDDADTLVQCVNLLWNLCESSELAIKYVGQSRILDILPRFLDVITFGDDIVTAVLQCILVIVEDNPLASEKIKCNSEKQLQQFLALSGDNPSALLMQVLAAGVIINISGGNMNNLPINVINQIVSILGNSLSHDHRKSCNELTSSIPLKNASGKIDYLTDKSSRDLENKIKLLTHVIDAQQCSIEIIANICSCEDSEDSSDDDSEDTEEFDEILCESGQETVVEDKLSSNIVEAITSQEIFSKVWAKAQLPAENVMMIMMEYEGSQLLHKKIQNLQTRALLCLNNMLSSLPIEELGGVSSVYKMWVEAGKLVFKQSSDNIILLESATAVMRAALDKITFRENGNRSATDLFKDLALTDIEMMLKGIGECKVSEIRSNMIRMIGILALLFVNDLNETTSSVICTITKFLLEQAPREDEVWVLAETLDTLVDMYSEDETDELASEIKLVEKMNILLPILKNKARQQKKLPKKYKALVSTTLVNLPRFIKYKKSRLSKL